MPLHPQCKFVLEQMTAAGGRPPEQGSAIEARAKFAAGSQARIAMAGPAQTVARVENRRIDTPERATPIRVYWPSTEENLPVLIYFHGGGWVVGNLDMPDRTCRALANAAQSIVVSVDYGLAPEHKFPQPVEEAYRVTEYVARHAKDIGAGADRIAIGGDSAGANLAAAVTLMSRERSGPRLAFQLLIYPMVDYGDDRPSLHEYDGYFLTRAGIEWFWAQYLRDAEDGRNPLASPLKAESLQGLPPAMIVTAECDPLRDQGEAYARKLQDAGVRVALKRYEGAIHGFFNMAGVIDAGKAAIAGAAQALREEFRAGSKGATSA